MHVVNDVCLPYYWEEWKLSLVKDNAAKNEQTFCKFAVSFCFFHVQCNFLPKMLATEESDWSK